MNVVALPALAETEEAAPESPKTAILAMAIEMQNVMHHARNVEAVVIALAERHGVDIPPPDND